MFCFVFLVFFFFAEDWNLPKCLQDGSRWSAAALDAGRSIELQQDHTHNIAQEQEVEEHRNTDGHHQDVIVVGGAHPAAAR